MNICTIIGVRPQFIKAAVLSPMIRKEHKEILIHTGQHYDANMSDVFFRELGLPKPNYTLMPVGGTAQEQIDSMVRQLIPIIQREKADAVLIYGGKLIMPGRPMYLYWIFPNRLLIQGLIVADW